MEEQIKTRHEFTSTDKDVKSLATKHEKETHGTSNDIDGNTHVDQVKGPSIAQRVKEEFESLVGAVIPKKDNN